MGANRDVVIGFDHLVDDIELMGIDANTAIAGDQAFRWVGTAALTGAGQVGFFTSGGNTIIRGQQRRRCRHRVRDPAQRHQGADGRRLLFVIRCLTLRRD